MKNSENIIPWDEVSSAAASMFRVWRDGGELEWAEECWGHFQKVGLADEDTVLSRTSSLIRLVTLARIYEEFAGFAWEESSETPVDFLAEHLKIDRVALGIIGARAEPKEFDDNFDDDEYQLYETALRAASNAQRKDIHLCLCAAYGGEIMLYSRMSRTHPSAFEDGNGEFEVTSGNCQALQYVQNGFQG